MKKTLLYIGHEFHKHTKSVSFLLDMLMEKYQVTTAVYSIETGTISADENEMSRYYDYIVIFQMPVAPELIESLFDFQVATYIPMYDGTGTESNKFWLSYKDFNIINFSLTLHNRLLSLGLSSYYVQYFPKPFENVIMDLGDRNSAFLWQRVNTININNTHQILDSLDIKNVHIHMSPDPNNKEIYPYDELQSRYHIEYSNWFDTKDETMEIVKRSAVYIVPRNYEGIGMSFLEAMAMGRCVVSINNPTMNEYIINGKNGILFTADSICQCSDIDIREIQKNAMETIKKGYKVWSEEKNKIYDWIEASPKINHEKFDIASNIIQYSKLYYLGKRVLIGKTCDGEYLLGGKIKLSRDLVEKSKKCVNKIFG